MNKKLKDPKIRLSEKSKEILASIESILSERGIKKTDFSALFDVLLISDGAVVVTDHFVNETTPTEYKVKMLLENPEKKADILKIVQSQSFGIEDSRPAQV